MNLAVEIALGGMSFLRQKLKSTNAENDRWLAGKAAVATRFGEPSLLVKLHHLDAGTPSEERTDVDHNTYKGHGGSIPLWVDSAIVGTITMSGEPDAIDHEAAAEASKVY